MTKIIEVENLSKKYIISHQHVEQYVALRDVMADTVKGLGKRIFHPFQNKSRPSLTKEDFWALKDVSFEINQGERVGIIGRNGAGKSTLLKVLSRITEPTTGRVTLKGRVASLLEVGTGFHPELTGRENIFLNGAILGMSRAEIKKKFDEIVDFAEVEKFLDTPVKRYSSGMYVRLAFAVAAHLEPEILIVDEVLAVGDAQFQKKCLGKMEQVGKEGRTVIFVSHNMAAVEQLCKAGIILENGTIKRKGNDVRSIIREYIVSNDRDRKSEWVNPGEQYRNEYFTPLRMYFTDLAGNPLGTPVRNDTEIWLNIIGEVNRLDSSLAVGYEMYTEEGLILYGSLHTDSSPDEWPTVHKGQTLLRTRIPNNFLNEGVYKIELNGGLLQRDWFWLPGRNNPSVFLEIKGGLSESPYWTEKRLGLIAPVMEWTN